MRLKQLSTSFAAALLISVAIVYIKPADVSAASFNSGQIISDSTFTNKSSMSVNDIQNFLNQKNSVCLKNYQTPEPLGNNNYGSNVSAARAIWKAGQLNLRAHNLLLFMQLGEGVDQATWIHHLRSHDYSTWIKQVIKDEALAQRVHDVEQQAHMPAEESRQLIRSAIEERYTVPAGGDEHTS